MRYYELTEAWKMAPHQYDVEEITEVLMRDCAPYLNEINGQIAKYTLWRGIKGNTAKGFGKKTARLSGRKPMTTKQTQHDIMNKFFVDNFEHPYRDGVFVTGDMMQANEYAHIGEWPHAIFPIGNFDYLWHPWVDDMYNRISLTAPSHTDELLDGLKPGYRQDGLMEAIATSGGREIMLWCEEYYYIERDKLEEIGKFLQ